jgi:hypothetical protein
MRLVYSATARCPCGLGLAYDADNTDPFKGAWDCSGILEHRANSEVKHTAALPFIFYEVKSEGQPSANGQTTRP